MTRVHDIAAELVLGLGVVARRLAAVGQGRHVAQQILRLVAHLQPGLGLLLPRERERMSPVSLASKERGPTLAAGRARSVRCCSWPGPHSSFRWLG